MNLPKDIWHYILDYLKISEWLALTLVCKRLNRFVGKSNTYLKWREKNCQIQFEYACKRGYYNIVSNILFTSKTLKAERGVPLAVEAQHTLIVDLLLRHCKGGVTVSSFLGAYNNNEDIFKMLIDTNMFHCDEGLCGAASGGHIERMKYLILRGATNFDLALSYASKYNQIESVKFLIKMGARGKKRCLQHAQKRGFIALQEYLETLL